MTSPEIDRSAAATHLVEDLNLQNDAEFFAEPESRIELLTSLTADDFFDLTKHVNDRVRGFEPKERVATKDKGSSLPLLATPSVEDKPVSLKAGFEAIQDYLADTDDSTEQRIKGAGMAVEALIIWVHPFNDGNGRTSRFLGKFIEDGATDLDQLVSETTEKNNRLRMYYNTLRVDQGNTIKGVDLILDDDEIEEYKKTEMPADEGIALSIKRLLEDKSMQEQVDATQARLKETQERSAIKLAA
jgi:hypothetical protein